MDVLRALLLLVCSVLCATQTVHDLNKDLQPAETQRKVHEIIQDHENYKYGGHGGHEYEDESPPRRRRIAYPDTAYPHPVAVKKNLGYKKQRSYYVTLAPKISSRYEKLEPINSKIYAYYPNADSHERHQPVVYYPTKDDSINQSSEYAPDGYHSNNKVYVAPQHKKYVAPLPPPPPHYQKHYVLPKKHIDEEEYKYAADHEGSAHHNHGHHEHHGAHDLHKEQGHRDHKDYEVARHKSHASKAGHHDHNSKYRNKGSYERDRGYHYEKAYAYDKIRAHHDIDKSHDSHTDYKADHGQENHHKKGHHGSHSYMYFKKGDRHGGHGYGKHGHVYNKHGHYKKAHDYHAHASLPEHRVSSYHHHHH